MKRREKWFWILFGTAFLIGLLALIPFNGEICEKANNSDYKECSPHNLPVYIAFKTQILLDSWGAAITALATIAIAWFTLSLRRSTDKLWDAGERQLKLLAETSVAQSHDMQASIAVAKKGAEAALKSADALISSERAHLFVTIEEERIGAILSQYRRDRPSALHGSDLETPSITYSFRNFGKTHAIIKEISAQIIIAERYCGDDEEFTVRDLPRNLVIGPGEKTQPGFGCLMIETLKTQDAERFDKRMAAFWFYGYVIFSDAFGRDYRFEYRFCCRSGDTGLRLEYHRERINPPDDANYGDYPV